MIVLAMQFVAIVIARDKSEEEQKAIWKPEWKRKEELEQQQEQGKAIVIAFVRCKGIGGDFDENSCMQNCHDDNSGKAHCCYCHSLQLRGLLLSQLIIMPRAAIVTACHNRSSYCHS